MALIGAALVFAVTAPGTLRLWRNDSSEITSTSRPSTVPALERAFRRAQPLMTIALSFVALAIAAAIIFPGSEYVWLQIMLISGIVVCELPAILIMLFNWPKVLVPPHLRDEPGLLTVRR